MFFVESLCFHLWWLLTHVFMFGSVSIWTIAWYGLELNCLKVHFSMGDTRSKFKSQVIIFSVQLNFSDRHKQLRQDMNSDLIRPQRNIVTRLGFLLVLYQLARFAFFPSEKGACSCGFGEACLWMDWLSLIGQGHVIHLSFSSLCMSGACSISSQTDAHRKILMRSYFEFS